MFFVLSEQKCRWRRHKTIGKVNIQFTSTYMHTRIFRAFQHESRVFARIPLQPHYSNRMPAAYVKILPRLSLGERSSNPRFLRCTLANDAIFRHLKANRSFEYWHDNVKMLKCKCGNALFINEIINAKKNILVIQKQGNNLIIRLTIYVSEITINLPPLRIPRLRHHRVTDWDPYFENADGQGINGSQNVALHLGATAYLDCRVAMLSGKKVCYIKLLAIN